MNIIGIIPSRYESTRFPGKPLADILGFPMVYRVYMQALKAKELSKVYVATDDSRIEKVCKNYNVPVIMTSKEHKNGTERLCEVAHNIKADIYVTIQGDEPLLEPKTILEVIETLLNSEQEVGCATLKIPYKNPIDVINSTTPKVVNDLNNNILLFTRSPIPYPKAKLDYIIYKPIGVYAFKRETLLKYNNLKKGPLEEAEDIELLRYIENGIKVKVGITESETIAVDTPKDLNRVIEILKKIENKK